MVTQFYLYPDPQFRQRDAFSEFIRATRKGQSATNMQITTGKAKLKLDKIF